MRHQNNVFHALTKRIPWAEFDRLVAEHRADRRVRRLPAKTHLLALLFGQLSGADSLRAIVEGLDSQGHALYHLGARPVARSTLADANAARPARLFAELFALMVARAGRGARRHMADAVRVLDATRLPLTGSGAAEGPRANKLHLVYDPDLALPLGAEITGAEINDITPAKAQDIAPGATYVFDLAYYDFAWWARLADAGCRFVTRLKSNTELSQTVERPCPADDPAILADRVGYLSKRLAGRRQNPFQAPLREVTVKLETGRVIRIASNDLEAPASEIAELYRRRWQIELFFRWIKQNLKIRKFLGTSTNAVAIQVFVALIAYLLLRAAHQEQPKGAGPNPGPLAFARLVRLNLMQRRPIDGLARPPEPPTHHDTRQLALPLNAA